MKTSNVPDHAQSDQHVHAMTSLAKESTISQWEGSVSYAPIAKALTTV